jgi:hypothetical protein
VKLTLPFVLSLFVRAFGVQPGTLKDDVYMLTGDGVGVEIPPVRFHFDNALKFLSANVTLFPAAPAVKVIGKPHQVNAKSPHQWSVRVHFFNS